MSLRTEKRLHSVPLRQATALLFVCLAWGASGQTNSAGAKTAETTKAHAVEEPSRAEPKPTEVRTPDAIRPQIRDVLQATSDNSAQGAGEGGVFKPSEDISEDFAVPFPVDI